MTMAVTTAMTAAMVPEPPGADAIVPGMHLYAAFLGRPTAKAESAKDTKWSWWWPGTWPRPSLPGMKDRARTGPCSRMPLRHRPGRRLRDAASTVGATVTARPSTATTDHARPQRSRWGVLEPCSSQSSDHRDGCCTDGAEDIGRHTICAVVTSEFLGHPANRFRQRPEQPGAGVPLPGPGTRRPSACDRRQLAAGPPRRGRRLRRPGLDPRTRSGDQSLEEHAVDVPTGPGDIDV